MTFATTSAAIALAGTLLAGPAPAAHLKTPGATPKVGVHWNYTITATEAGKPAAATLTEQIVDPIGGVHPVQFGKGTKNITNWHFKGTFKDFIIWPASSRGIPLELRAIVKVGGKTKVLLAAVTPR